MPSNSSSHWAIDNVYIGKGCPRMCNGHGRCNSINQCVCDEGFSGVDCSVSSRPLARELKVNGCIVYEILVLTSYSASTAGEIFQWFTLYHKHNVGRCFWRERHLCMRGVDTWCTFYHGIRQEWRERIGHYGHGHDQCGCNFVRVSRDI